MAQAKVFRTLNDLCTGCRICELVCSLQKTGIVNPYLARIRVLRSSKDGMSKPIICRHCKVPLCQQACPVPQAMSLDAATGAVVVNTDKCTRCLACVEACPFKAMWVGPGGEVLKCDLCGGEPVCVKYCPPRPENQFPHMPYPRRPCLEYSERRPGG